MEICCTRPGCPSPQNFFTDLDDSSILKTVQQKYCTTCGMPLILVARYLPLKLLGRGGFGAAFLALDRYTPAMRRCVVKQFQPAGNLSPQQLSIAQKLFEREAEVLEVLGNQHPKIPDLFAFFPLTVPSLEAGKEDQFFYIVQEFIDGKNLEEELVEKGQFSQAEVLEVLREILPVLKFVHEHHSIHRDIKPSNIMRDRKGRLYLLDFGAVKQVTKATPGSSSTGIYSMGFAPPEQMSGGQVYPSTDLYALAVTCITLLTGKQPAELFDVYSNQWNWRGDAQVSDSLANILDRMLLPAPNQRFQSAEELLALLTPKASSPPPPQAVSTTQPPQPSPPPPQSSQPVPSPPPPPPQRQPRFSLLEVLIGAAFTGFEGALLYIAVGGLGSLLPSLGIRIGLLGMIMGGLIFAQYRRIIEGKDLLILIGLTLAVIRFAPGLKEYWLIHKVLILATLTAAAAVAITALFRLVYKLLKSVL